MRSRTLAAVTLLIAAPLPAGAQSLTSAQFVNGITIDGATTDLSSGTSFERRLGFFSDLYYDAGRDEWWALSDRGPGGGTLPYETRVQRFTLGVDASTGAISAFQVQQTIKFMNGGSPLSGLAPNPTNALGSALDPEGLAIDPRTGNILVSDEYGPSLYEFDRTGNLVRQFATPANLLPRNGSGVPNFASDVGNVAGRTTNRGFEGLAVSPDGTYAYAVLQSGMLDEVPANGNGRFARIVKFDMTTGAAVGQYAYQFSATGQGRGVSAITALGNGRFLVIERNNRGVGVGATLATADKNVFQIDLAGATDITNATLAGGLTLPPGITAVQKSAQLIDLDANTLAALGGRSPEKWEGLAVGPRLNDGRHLLLAGTDNDYSVTQNANGTQFDVWFDFTKPDPYASSIQCPLGLKTGCVRTDDGSAEAWKPHFTMLPGLLHAYAAAIDGYVAPSTVPEPATVSMLALGLGLAGLALRRRA